jgi:hypothetical protein
VENNCAIKKSNNRLFSNQKSNYKKMKNKIYVDITSTLQAPYVSGIQRVVTNIAKVLDSLGGDEIVFVKFNSKYYVKADLNFRAHYELPFLIKTVHLPVIREIKGLIPQIIKNSIVELLIKFKRNNFRFKNNNQNEIEIIKGDKLILLDATWNYSPWHKIRQYKESGAIVGQVVYDLLPIEMPENFTNILAKKFSLWFQMIQYYSDEFYCISNSVKENLISKIDDKKLLVIKGFIETKLIQNPMYFGKREQNGCGLKYALQITACLS